MRSIKQMAVKQLLVSNAVDWLVHDPRGLRLRGWDNAGLCARGGGEPRKGEQQKALRNIHMHVNFLVLPFSN